MKLTKLFYLIFLSIPGLAEAQYIRQGYLDKGVCGTDFPVQLDKWERGQKWTTDDNFFISRVKPHVRFRNTATQVNSSLNEENDKKLIFWVPANNQEFNALPDGRFDSEVFPMWSYITHYGNWSTPLVRMPGGFADVAHKNGVPVSVLASIPYGNITQPWKDALTTMTEIGAEKLADFLLYYGVDGIGYNSEFKTITSLITALCGLHENTVKIMKEKGGNPLTEFIWYDGTNKNGAITFDRGLDEHNKETWGYGDNIRTSLFLNYNWNYEATMEKIVTNAEKYGRTPLDIYCGINMQGREPYSKTQDSWALLAQYPISIGLWGAHSENMFFESRAEQGSGSEKHQRTYQNRMLNWFTNGSHNPIADHPITNSLVYSAANNEFFGMSKMMSARSALKWDLAEEPFITYFNLGNGRFFNYKGRRCHNSEWYNIAMQDYLPTWMWWFSSKFMGRESSDIVPGGLQAEFVWDDAWMGGSTIRIHGTTTEEYLHLFKTEFALKQGDEISLRYKVINGESDAHIIMSTKGNEEQPAIGNAMQVMSVESADAPGKWIEKTFIVGRDITLSNGSEVAMIALRFNNASDLDMRLGEFSIKRPETLRNYVDPPVIESSTLLNAWHDGVDGKIIFNMPNDKGDDVCYNLDVNTSLFKLYYQQEAHAPILMGMTTSWAGLMFSAPYVGCEGGSVRFGVSALALDHTTESEIAWGEWYDTDNCYAISDEICISGNVLKPGEPFSVGYVDSKHQPAHWSVIDSEGKMIAEANGVTSLVVADGIVGTGIYDLKIKGMENIGEEPIETERLLKGYIQITGEDAGDVPVITDLYTNDGKEMDSNVVGETPEYASVSTEPTLFYSIEPGNATLSRGVHVGENGFGFRFKDTEIPSNKSFAVSFWFKPESFANKSVHALNIRHKGDPWSVNHWGWLWHTFTEDGRSDAFTIRMDNGNNASYKFDEMKLTPGAWYHIAYSFEFDDNKNVLPALFVNGERQRITSWSIGDAVQRKEVEFVGPVGNWKNDNVVAFGGYLHKSGSVRGNLDNFMVWDKALTEEDVAVAMGDIDVERLPENLVGYFNFEENAGKEGLFSNIGRDSFSAGIHGYKDTEVEGQGVLQWKSPDYCAGVPFIKGDAFELEPEISWETPGARIIETADNGKEGHIKLSFPEEGIVDNSCTVRLTVANEFGADHRDIVLHFASNGVETIEKAPERMRVSPTCFESEISVIIPTDGNITLRLFNLEGRCVLANDFEATAGETLKIYPEVMSGVYILHAEKNGIQLGSVKVIRR